MIPLTGLIAFIKTQISKLRLPYEIADETRLVADNLNDAESFYRIALKRDEALVRSEEIRREGREEAGRILGQAEKQAAEIYAKAHQLDPEFYQFWRSLQAVKRTLGAKATVILRTDQGFFDVLSNPPTPTKARDSQSSAAGQPLTGQPPQ